MERKTLKIDLVGGTTGFQKIVGLINRNKIKSISIDYNSNQNTKNENAHMTATLEADVAVLNRFVSTMQSTSDVKSVTEISTN